MNEHRSETPPPHLLASLGKAGEPPLPAHPPQNVCGPYQSIADCAMPGIKGPLMSQRQRPICVTAMLVLKLSTETWMFYDSMFATLTPALHSLTS